jgi:hypothetical protein
MGLIEQLSAKASAASTVAGTTSTAEVEESNPFTASQSADGVFSLAGGFAEFDVLGSKLEPVFLNPSTVVLGTGAMGTGSDTYSGTGTAAKTFTSSIAWTANGADLPGKGKIYLGLDTGSAAGGGFANLTFSLSENGVTLLNQAFTSAASASAFFNNNVETFGAFTENSTGQVGLVATLSETLKGSGNGYGVDFILGVHS